MHILRSFAAALLLCAAPLLGGGAAAQTGYFFPAGQEFDPAIPSPAHFLGYDIGTHHTRHDQIVAYFRELDRLSDRASYREIGRTYEHRVMPVLTVTAPQNHARLEEIRREHLRAIDPAAAAAAPGDRTVIVHLGFFGRHIEVRE